MFWATKNILTETDNLIPKDRENSKEESVWYNARIKTNIGWMPWKDREASLFRLFERCFYARKMELHVMENLEDLKIDVEIPASQEVSFRKIETFSEIVG